MRHRIPERHPRLTRSRVMAGWPPVRGRLRQGFFGSDRLGFAVTCADIAAFTAAQVDDPRYVGAAPAISN